MIGGRYWMLSILALAMGYIAMYAPSAGAKPNAPGSQKLTPALPGRTCRGLVPAGDIPNAGAEEFQEPQSPIGQVKTGNFLPKGFDPTTTKLSPSEVETYCSEGSPKCAGYGTYTTLTVLWAKYWNSHARKIRKGNWASGYTRHQVKNLGTVAEFGYNGEQVLGWLQIRNYTFSIEGGEGITVLPLLEQVARELCSSCG